MRAARPATGPPHSFFQLRAHPFDVLLPGLRLLDGDGPADPLVARKGSNILPCCVSRGIGHERLPQILRHPMRDTRGNSVLFHVSAGASRYCLGAIRRSGAGWTVKPLNPSAVLAASDSGCGDSPQARYSALGSACYRNPALKWPLTHEEPTWNDAAMSTREAKKLQKPQRTWDRRTTAHDYLPWWPAARAQ